MCILTVFNGGIFLRYSSMMIRLNWGTYCEIIHCVHQLVSNFNLCGFTGQHLSHYSGHWCSLKDVQRLFHHFALLQYIIFSYFSITIYCSQWLSGVHGTPLSPQSDMPWQLIWGHFLLSREDRFHLWPEATYLSDNQPSSSLETQQVLWLHHIISHRRHCGMKNWSPCLFYDGFLLLWLPNIRGNRTKMQQRLLFDWGTDTESWHLLLSTLFHRVKSTAAQISRASSG